MENKGWNYLEEQFNVSRDELSCYRFEERAGSLWLVSEKLETELETQTKGIRALRDRDQGLKPTTYFLQLLGDKIKRNMVKVDRDEALKLLRREEMIERDLGQEGYVALRYEGRVLGCGFYKNGKVSSRIPKARSQELEQVLSS
ncbi:MAG: hypothetical protein ABEJ83_00605 [Candidatus Nanohaloarchaea archaeon]